MGSGPFPIASAQRETAWLRAPIVARLPETRDMSARWHRTDIDGSARALPFLAEARSEPHAWAGASTHHSRQSPRPTGPHQGAGARGGTLLGDLPKKAIRRPPPGRT